MVGRLGNPARWVAGRIPKNRRDIEITARSLLRLAFWLALLAPVILVPAYYLLVAYGLMPPIHLPSG